MTRAATSSPTPATRSCRPRSEEPLVTTRYRSRMALAAPAILLVAAGFWTGKSLSTATLTPIVQTGTVGIVGGNGDEFTILLSGQREPTSYGLPSNINWRDRYGVWQQGTQ